MKVLVTYDPKFDLAYLYFQPDKRGTGAVAHTANVATDINIDWDADGKIFGIELLNASTRLDLDAIKEQHPEPGWFLEDENH